MSRTATDNDPQRVTHVRIEHGVMIQTSELREETTYTVRDDDTAARTVLIEHPLRSGWIVSSDTPKPDETTSSAFRFKVPVEAKNSATLVVHESKPLSTNYQISDVDDDQLKLFVQPTIRSIPKSKPRFGKSSSKRRKSLPSRMNPRNATTIPKRSTTINSAFAKT